MARLGGWFERASACVGTFRSELISSFGGSAEALIWKLLLFRKKKHLAMRHRDLFRYDQLKLAPDKRPIHADF